LATRSYSTEIGKRIERSEIGAPGEFEALADDELERAIVERFQALGLSPDSGSERRHWSIALYGGDHD
jgi:hypothetical protein